MTDTQLASLERTILAIAVFILTAFLVVITAGQPEFGTIWPVLVALDSGVVAYWFGQTSQSK